MHRALLRARGSAERVPHDPRLAICAEHRARYRWAAQHIAAGPTLDVACGSGLGLDILAHSAALVVAVDLEEAALLSARSHRNRALVRADATRLPFRASAFTGVTSFETLEHVPDAAAVIEEIRRVLAPGGQLLASSPNALVTKPVDGVPRNPHHVKEFEPDELRELLGRTFASIEVFGQVVSASYGRSSLWDAAESPWDHVRRLSWKLASRLPAAVTERFAQWLLGRTFFPREHDFDFTEDMLDRAHVTVARCR